MRFVGSAVAGAALLLAGCGDWKSGQANNAQGNISNESRVPETANASADSSCECHDAARRSAAEGPSAQDHARASRRHGRTRQGHEDAPPRARTPASPTSTWSAPDRDDGRNGGQSPGLVPGRNRPRRRQDPREARNLEAAGAFPQEVEGIPAAARAIDAAARAGDVNKVMALHENVDKACKACHDPVPRAGALILGQAAGVGPSRSAVPLALAALILFSWWSVHNHHTDWHIWSGCAILTLLIFRLLWGFVGSSTARFSSFVRGPARDCAITCAGHGAGSAITRSARSAFSRYSRAVAVQVGLGLFSEDEDGLYMGPLAAAGQHRYVGQGARPSRTVVQRHPRADRAARRRDPLLPARAGRS